MKPVAGLILAAGESRRMGSPKPLLRAGETTFLETVRGAMVAGGLDPVRVVLGHRAAEVQSACRLDPAEIVLNEHYRDGMLSSLIAGIRALESSAAEAFVLALVDGPAITAPVVRTLVAAFRENPVNVVEPTYRGQRGHPVLVSRAIWPEIVAADPAEGAKMVVRRHRPAGRLVEVDDPGILVDLDTPEEYVAWLARGKV